MLNQQNTCMSFIYSKKPIKYNLQNLLHFKSHVLHIKRRLGWNHFNLHDKIQTHVTK